MKILKSLFWCLIFTVFPLSVRSYVTAEMRCQLGNNLFIISTASALAWDNYHEAYFPDLKDRYEPRRPSNVIVNYEHVLFRCEISPLPGPVTYIWSEPSFAYHPIHFHPNMQLEGYFQSEKYFVHYRERLLELFAPRSDDLDYMKKKYGWLIKHPTTVGIQLRELYDDAIGERYWQFGKDFLRKAMAYFPADSLFVISSNNVEFARANIPEEMKNVFVLENEPHYIDLFLLSFCKHNIISNSTFGWWAAWLNQNPNKIVVAPRQYFAPHYDVPMGDFYPKDWILIESKFGPLINPQTYQ